MSFANARNRHLSRTRKKWRLTAKMLFLVMFSSSLVRPTPFSLSTLNAHIDVTVSGGDVFPGDCVVFLAEALTVTQASLTGELMPVEKMPRLDLPPAQFDFEILDNPNVCLAGTSVATGSGQALIISTGSETYIASIAKDLAKKRPLNSFQIGIRNVSYILMAFMAASRFLRFQVRFKGLTG
jgi:magnesium-transporting ATPase (P-type)